MAATFRSHFRHPPAKESTASQEERRTASRVPAKPSSSNADTNKSSKAAQHVSRLAKRASRSITPSDKTDPRATAVAKESVPGPAARNPAVAARNTQVVQPVETTYTGPRAPSNPRRPDSALQPPMMRTPSLFSGSSVSTFDSPRQNALRRKPSTIEKYAASKRAGNSEVDANSTNMRTRDMDIDEAFEDSVLGITLPQTTYVHHDAYVATNPKYRLPTDLMPTDQPVTRDITPPVPYYAQSATPSTRYTDSPFSHVPTPSSASSYSPAVVTTTGATPRLRQQSPTRNRLSISQRPYDKNDTSRLGLPTVRESSTSSSNSTVKPSGRPAPVPKDIPRKSATAPPSSKPSENQRPTSRGKLVKENPRQKSTSSNSKPTQQIPPELAHLNVDPPPRSNLNKALPPIRPSRDGTPTLTDITSPSTVVQSDLPKVYNTYHKRTPSQESNNPTSPLKSRFGLSPKPTPQESPRIDSAISPPPAARAFARGPTPDKEPVGGSRLTRRDSPAIGPGPSPSKSPRFGFFSRKPKPDVSKPAEKPKRQPTKGPVAGTGHEGYGRFGIRGRSGSATSNTGFRSPSTDSTASSIPKRNSQGRKSSVTSKESSELDDFLRQRLNPVVLRGSGGSTVSNAASGSETQAPSGPNSKTSSLDSYPKPQLLPSAMGNDAGPSPTKRPHPNARAPSESSEDDVSARYPSLAARRSLTRLSQGDRKPSVRMPAPIDTSRPSKDSSLDSYDAEGSALARSDSTLPTDDPFEGREGLLLRAQKEEAEVKPSRRWNFFQRAQASPRSKGKERAVEVQQSPASPPQQSPYRSVAHYATFDPVEPVGLEEVERIMQETETSPEDSMSESNNPPKMVPYERRHLSLLPYPPQAEYMNETTRATPRDLPTITVRHEPSMSPELMRAQQTVPHSTVHVVDIKRSPITYEPPEDVNYCAQQSQLPRPVHTPEVMHSSLGTPENQFDDSPARQPRLSPVGRIPQVVSKRDRDRKLSDNSFSRPFARTQPRPSVQPPGFLYTQIRELASPIESGSQPVSSTSTRSDNNSGEQKSSVNTNEISTSTNRTSMDMHGGEFFAFAPRKDSDLSYSSSSGNYSWMATIGPQLEDVWNEYNDLLDDVMPERSPLLTGSSLGAPFQYSSMLYEPSSVPYQNAIAWNGLPWTHRPLPPAPNGAVNVLSVPQQVARFMQPSMSPLTTPSQLAEFVDHYGNRSTSTLISTNRTSIPGPRRPSLAQSTRSSILGPSRNSTTQTSRTSLPSNRGSVTSSRHSRASGHSRSASLPEANARNSQSSLTPSVRFARDTQLLDIAEVEGDDYLAAANLRFGALMTSKWLSFGRVLFSPADNEMRLADDPKILILDGLGSDWSFYVALSYPSATVYNLGPAPVDGSAWPGVNQKPPSNHKHINLTSISTEFPFPKGFFTAVVFRFPLVATDDAYHRCIFECKRVLRPGGYLEVAVLDLDLMNMGSRARKAVRGLKTRMQEQDKDVSLRNLSDVLVRFIGRRGFEDVQRCIVGVPAAGRIPRSQDLSSVSSGASGGTSKPIWQREERRQRHSRGSREEQEEEFSFADLLEDARANTAFIPGAHPGDSNAPRKLNNDESITKMVAKVGRWWYSTCYERALFPPRAADGSGGAGGASIWADRALLRECEKQGTSFRLLICHAQKPAVTRRRTVSV